MNDYVSKEMTLEEAIAHLHESLGEEDRDWGCDSCKHEHEQLLGWLEELQEVHKKVEKLKKHIADKCYEIKHKETIYNSRKRDLLTAYEIYSEKGTGLNRIESWSRSAKLAYDDYAGLKFETKQLCYALGDEYVEIYNRIIGEDE